MSIGPNSLPPGPPYGDGTPFGYGDAYGNGFGNSYAYGVAGIGYGSSSYISSLGGIVSVTPVKTDPKRQYIAARPGQAYTPDIAVTLSAEWDEMLGQSSAVLSRRMLLDPQVRSAWNYFKFSVLADGPILSPAVTPEEGRELTPEEQAECDLAKEITDYCLRQQERIERPIDEVLGQLFDGCIHRGAIVEKVEEPIEDGPDKGKRGLKALVTLPSTAWAFVTDLYGKNVGVAGWTADGPKVLDPRHFAIFTWEPKAGDPRGTNILDAAFSAWNEKVSLVPERFRHLVLFGSPSTVYELPEGAQPQAQLDQYGNPDYTRAPIDPIYQGMQQLSAFRGGGQMVHSHGGKVSLIDAANDGGAFTAAKMDCNREIATAILLTPGSTMEAQHDSNANAQTKQDATGILIRRAQARLASVYRGVLKELITPNWGNDVAARLTPKVAFAVEHHDQAATIGTWSQAGWAPDPVQYQEIDAKVGLRTPRPDQAVADDAVEDDQDEKEEEEAVFSESEREDDAVPFLVTAGLPSLPVIASEDKPCSRLAMMSALGKELTPVEFSLCKELERQYLDGEISREVLFAHTPCRDARGRFMSCGGGGGAKKSTKAKGRGTKARKAKADKLRAARKAKQTGGQVKPSTANPKTAKSAKEARPKKPKTEPKPKPAKEVKLDNIPSDVRPEKLGKMRIDPKVHNEETRNFLEEHPHAKLTEIPITPALHDKVMGQVEHWRKSGDERELGKLRSILSADKLPPPIIQFYKSGNVGVPDGFHRVAAYVVSGRKSIRGYSLGEAPQSAKEAKAKPNLKSEKPAKEAKPKVEKATSFAVKTHGNVTSADHFQIAVDRLPDTVKTSLVKAGITIHHAENIEVFRPILANEHPRGWPEGTTWKNAGGLYDPNYKQVVVSANSQPRGTNTWQEVGIYSRTDTMRHEVGHAYDSAIGHASQTEEFKSAYHADVAALPKEHHEKFSYFLQKGYAGPQEAFAETFAHLNGGGALFTHGIIEHFPQSAEYIRKRQAEPLG